MQQYCCVLVKNCPADGSEQAGENPDNGKNRRQKMTTTVNFFRSFFDEEGYEAFLDSVDTEYKKANPNAYERWAEEVRRDFIQYSPCRYEDSDTVAELLIPYVGISEYAVTLYDYRGDTVGEPDQPLFRLKFENAVKTAVDVPFNQVEWDNEKLELLEILLEELHNQISPNKDDSVDDNVNVPVDEII